MLRYSVDKKDLNQIGELIHKEIKANYEVLMSSVDKEFKNNNEMLSLLIDLKFDKFENRFEQKILKWKSEIVDSVDGMAKEIRDESEFREISSHQTSGNTRRIEKLESKVFGAVQSVV